MVGAGDPRSLDVSGEAPNLAARLQSIAEPGTLLISDELRRMLGRRVDAQDLGQVAVKGWADPLKVWKVRRGVPQLDRFEVRMAERHTPMVGRAAEAYVLL